MISPTLIQVEYFTTKDELNEWLRKEGQTTFRIDPVMVLDKHPVYIAQYRIDNPEWVNDDLPF